MRIAVALAASLSLVSMTACAQTEMTTSMQAMDDSVYVVFDKDNPVIPMAAWEEGAMAKMAAGPDAASAPSGAVTYKAKQVIWPTARVRVMMFDKANGGVLHPITDETLLYVMSGSAEVGVGTETVKISEGDVVSFPSGTLRNAGMASDATILTWTAPSLTTETTPTYVAGDSVEGRDMGAIALKRYTFPGNSVRVVELRAGNTTGVNSAKTDSLIYVTGGPMTFNQNGQSFVVNEGDFIREIAGLDHNWNVTSDSGFVTTSGKPLDMDVIDPDKATDVPPQ